MKVYCIRQKSTGLFIPRLKNGQRRGGSHLEPSNEREPRVFHNAIAARAFLSSWLKGIFENTALYDDDGPDVKCTPQPHRKKDDMEIVEFECAEIEQSMVPQTDEYYWIKLDGGSHMLIGKWHGTGFWVGGNDLDYFGLDQGLKIVSHITKPTTP